MVTEYEYYDEAYDKLESDPIKRNEKLSDLMKGMWKGYKIKYIVRLPLDDPESHEFGPKSAAQGWRFYYE